MRRTFLLVLACLAAACTSKATVDLRSPGQWPASCLQPNVICSAGAQGLGDGGPALAASFALPESIALDSTGNVFVADEYDQRIRRIDGVTGVVTTVVGDGLEGPGDDIPPNTLAAQADLDLPGNVAVCPDGWLLFSQANGGVVWGVDPASDKVVAVAGDPNGSGVAIDDVPADQASFRFESDISALTCDANDVVVIADTNNFVIRGLNRGPIPVDVGGVTIQPGYVSILAGVAGNGSMPGADGPDARASVLEYPLQGFSLGDGRLLVDDDGSHRLRLVTPTGAIRTVLNKARYCCDNSGDGDLAVDATINFLPGVWSDGTRVFMTAPGEVRLLNLDSSGSVSFSGVTVGPSNIDRLGGQLDGTPLSYPYGDGGAAVGQAIDGDIAPPVLSPTGELWFAEPSAGLIRKIDASGVMSVAAGYAGANGPDDYLVHPDDLVVSADGGLLMTAENGHLWRLAPGAMSFTSFAGDGSPTPGPDGVLATNGGMVPSAIAVAPDGSVFVFDIDNQSLRVIGPSGRIETLCPRNDYQNDQGNGGLLKDANISDPESAIWWKGLLLWQDDYYGIRAANLTDSAVTVAGISIPPGGVDHIAGVYQNGDDTGDVPALQAHFVFGGRGSQMFVLGDELWINDADHGLLRTLDLKTGIVHTVNQPSDDQEGTPLSQLYLYDTHGLAYRDGWIYFTDHRDRVRRARLPDGPVETVAGDGFGESGDGATALLAQIEDAGQIAITPDGVLWVTERGHRLRRIQPGGLP